MISHNIKQRFFTAFWLFSFSTPALAYIDPGTGAMLVQAFLALAAAIVFYVRNPKQLWDTIRKWLAKGRKP